MIIYFVTDTSKAGLEVIRELKPKNVLVSYWYFKNKPMNEFCDEIGYMPNILLDSGAYSAFTKGKTVNVLDYMRYITDNLPLLESYISLDVITDTQLSVAFYDLMRMKGFDPIPVYHYGEDQRALDHYLIVGSKRIALGGTVPIKDKRVVAEWCKELHSRHPDIDFHLLGSTSKVVLESDSVSSCDASSWYMMAVNGYPKEITGKTRGAKIERAKYNMKKLMGCSS